MKIGINCLSVKTNYVGGVTSFTLGILDGFLEINSNNTFQIYTNKYNNYLFDKYKKNKNVSIIVLENYTKLKKAVSDLSMLFLPEKIFKIINNYLFYKIDSFIDKNSDIIYTTSPTLISYNNKIIKVISMHDIQHIHYPEYFNYFVRKFRTRNYMYTAKSCNYLQASSKYIKKDFLKNFSFLKQNQVFMINEGVNIKNFKINKRTALKNISKYNLPSEFIFYPAQLWHHKNHITILKALKKIRDKDNLQINLVLTGEKFSASKTIFKKIDEFNLQNQIFYLGKVTFKDLLSLYSVSKFFITATLYESSSLPALESACIGTPIIASATPPNKEMSSLLKLNLFDAGDFNSLSRVILEIWSDREKIKKQINHNLKHVKNYSWNNIALKYCDFFHSFLSEK